MRGRPTQSGEAGVKGEASWKGSQASANRAYASVGVGISEVEHAQHRGHALSPLSIRRGTRQCQARDKAEHLER